MVKKWRIAAAVSALFIICLVAAAAILQLDHSRGAGGEEAPLKPGGVLEGVEGAARAEGPENSGKAAYAGQWISALLAEKAAEKAHAVMEQQAAAADAGKTVALQLYFLEQAALEGGRCGEYGLVAPVVRTLPYTEGVLRLALQELIRGPLPTEEGLGAVLPGNTRLLNLELAGGLALIDLSREALCPDGGGAVTASGLMQSIVYTATQFPAVDAVLLLVGGILATVSFRGVNRSAGQICLAFPAR